MKTTMNAGKRDDTLTIVDLTKRGVMAEFSRFRNNYLYYNISLIDDKAGQVYRLVLDPVDFVDCDLEAVCNASLFRRWIRTAWQNGELNRVS